MGLSRVRKGHPEDHASGDHRHGEADEHCDEYPVAAAVVFFGDRLRVEGSRGNEGHRLRLGPAGRENRAAGPDDPGRDLDVRWARRFEKDGRAGADRPGRAEGAGAQLDLPYQAPGVATDPGLDVHAVFAVLVDHFDPDDSVRRVPGRLQARREVRRHLALEGVRLERDEAQGRCLEARLVSEGARNEDLVGQNAHDVIPRQLTALHGARQQLIGAGKLTLFVRGDAGIDVRVLSERGERDAGEKEEHQRGGTKLCHLNGNVPYSGTRFALCRASGGYTHGPPPRCPAAGQTSPMSPDRRQLPSPSRNRALVPHLLVLSWIALGVSGCGDDGDPARDSGVDAPTRDAARDVTPDAGDHEAPNPASIGAVACILDPDCTEVMVAAHRGHFVFVPENSLAAIREAARIGAEVVELDIRPTSDGVLVAMHDSTVDRTTDGAGEVDALSWAEVSALSLNGGDPADAETYRVPRFSEALAVAREEGLAVYVDIKGPTAEVAAAVAAADAYDIAILRDNLAPLIPVAVADPALVVMPSVEDEAELTEAIAAIPSLAIVEIGQVGPRPALMAAARGAGLKIQQDVLAEDIAALTGDCSLYAPYVDLGLFLFQTNRADILIPAVWRYRRTGEFPDRCPAPVE